MKTLWDFIDRVRKPPVRPAPVARPVRPRPEPPTAHEPPPDLDAIRATATMRERYAAVERFMLKQHGVRVRKWRSSMSGVAWQVTYRDGSIAKLIESPRPRGPMSAAVFLHEIGHHAIGFGVYRPRCLEEFHAWKFSIDTMRECDLNVSDRVLERMHDSLHYALEKAARRGLKRIPEELLPYTQPRLRRRSA
ncbi:MAG: hypothetical protein AAGD00_10430 [Planctomycetota bacterium]